MRAEVEAQLEGEAVHVDALHLSLWGWEAPGEKAKGWEQESCPELLHDPPPHLKPPPSPPQLIFIKNLLSGLPWQSSS